MAHGVNTLLKRGTNSLACKNDGKAGIGSRRIFAPQFKLQVLDSYRNDADCKGNQRATARKYGIHRRQIQKWLQVENNLRNSVIKSKSSELIVSPEARKCGIELALRSGEHRQRDDVSSEAYSERQRQVGTGAELEHGTVQRIGGPEARDATVDKRVPDIPQHTQHSPSSTQSSYQWRNNNRCSEPSSDSDREIEFADYHYHRHQKSSSVCSPTTSPSLLVSPQPIPIREAAIASPVFKCECPDPELTQLPLDFTTHSRRAGPNSPRDATSPPVPQAIADYAAPMDLSLKKPYIPYPRIESDLHTPVFVCSSAPELRNSTLIQSDHPPTSCVPQIWDLSTRGVKRPHDDDVTNNLPHCPNVSSSTCDTKPAVQDIKPIKLFKPYLLDQTDDSSSSSNDTRVPASSFDSCKFELGYTSNNSTVYSDTEQYFYNNNNTDYKTEYPYYKDETYNLDLRRNGHYYCPVNTEYYTGSNIHLGNHYEETKNLLVYSKNTNAIKQRQSYSLDFKLSAIQCYYSDAVCRGNQRAVATKYKIHRRQVQKWLKQEDQLRQRNETSKHMHIVR